MHVAYMHYLPCNHIAKNLQFTVVYRSPEAVSITQLWPNGTSVRAGDSVSIQCQFNKVPINVTHVQWLEDGSLISTDKHYETEEEDGLSSILTTIIQNETNYTCSCLLVTTTKNVTSNSLSITVTVVKGMHICIV